MLLRILLIFIGLWIIVKAINHARSRRVREQGSEKLSKPGKMQRCAYCSTFIPENESISDGQKYFCSEKHRHASLNGPED